MRCLLTPTMAALLVAPCVSAGEPTAITTDWNGFEQHVSQRKLHKRMARISLTSGDVVEAFVLRVDRDGLVVRPNPKIEQWTFTKAGDTTVRCDLISRVAFTGKVGRGRLIGFLAGLGGGVGLTASIATQRVCEDGCGGVQLVIPVAAAAGYFIGRAVSPPAPVFVIER